MTEYPLYDEAPTAEEMVAIVKNNDHPVQAMLDWLNELERARKEMEDL